MSSLRAHFTKTRLRKVLETEEEVETFQNLRNGLANLQLLDGAANREKQQMAPAKWLEKMFPSPEDRASYCDKHLLGHVPDDMREFLDFYQLRQKRLRERIEELLPRGSAKNGQELPGASETSERPRMNTSSLSRYAPEARRAFIAAVTARAAAIGLRPDGIDPIVEEGDVALIGGQPFPRSVAEKRRRLEERIARTSFDQVMEAMAYTWFNRFMAIRYMELHGYLDHGYRVLSHPEGKGRPEILEHAS